jgi:hypothetical protein
MTLADVLAAQAAALRAQADALDALASAERDRERALAPQRDSPGRLFGTVADFASQYGWSLRYVENLVRQGLPTVGRGRARRVDLATAAEWLRAGGADGSAVRLAQRDARRRASARALDAAGRAS